LFYYLLNLPLGETRTNTRREEGKEISIEGNKGPQVNINGLELSVLFCVSKMVMAMAM